MKQKNWKITLFTWVSRTFLYLVPCGYTLWTFLIETLISEEATMWDKLSCSSIVVVCLIGVIAIFFFGKFLNKKITDYTNLCIECVDNNKKRELVLKKKKWEARQEIFRNACFVAPFIIGWFIISLIEKKVVSLRGTLMVISISMSTGFGFNSLTQWLKTKEAKREIQG